MHHRRQVPRIGVDGKAEQQKLHHRHADHQRKRHAVAPHLDEFLHQDGEQPGEGEPRHAAALTPLQMDEHVLEAGRRLA